MAQTALDLERRVSGPDSADSIWRENNLASNLEKDGRLADATAMYRDVLKRARAVYTHGEWDLGQFEYRLAKLLINTGKAEEGRPLLADSVAILTHSLGPAAVPTTRASALLTSAAAAKP
jgi:hypothetical protein